MDDERASDPGTSPVDSGTGDHRDSADEQTSGRSTSSDGNRPDGRHRSDSSERIKWAGVTASLVTIAIIIVQMFGVLDDNNENSEINKSRTEKILEHSEDLANELENLQNQVDGLPEEIPTAPPTVIVQEGQPGKPGKPGKVVTAPPKTVIVEKPVPGPTVTVEPSKEPKCNNKLGGTCILP